MKEAPGEFSAATVGIEYDLPCPNCAYNLRGLPAIRCPECSYALSASELIASEIPWTRRRARGRIRSYCQTVWMVTFSSRRISKEVDRDVRYDDAQRFRWVTVMLVYLPWLFSDALLVAVGEWDRLDILEFGVSWKAAATQAVPFGSMLLFLAAVTGLPSYFFHPRYLPFEIQNRGIALSYYTCGVLAWLLPAYVFFVAAAFVTPRFHLEEAIVIGLATAGGIALLVAIHWGVLVRKLANQILGAGRAWKTTWLLIPLWLLLAVGSLVVLPGMIFLIMLMVSSVA